MALLCAIEITEMGSELCVFLLELMNLTEIYMPNFVCIKQSNFFFALSNMIRKYFFGANCNTLHSLAADNNNEVDKKNNNAKIEKKTQDVSASVQCT